MKKQLKTVKAIENKETNLYVSETEKLKYSDLLIAVINTPIKEGITLKQMKADLALLAKFDSAKPGDLIELEDEELSAIKSLVENHKWGMRHIDINTFGEYIDSL